MTNVMHKSSHWPAASACRSGRSACGETLTESLSERGGTMATRECSTVYDLRDELDQALAVGFDSLVVPLSHPRFKTPLPAVAPPHKTVNASDDVAGQGVFQERETGLRTRSDMVLPMDQWSSSVVGAVSTWIDLDNEDVRVRESAERVFKQEIAWATHLSLRALLLPPPRCSGGRRAASGVCNYARCLNQAVQQQLMHVNMWVRVPCVRTRPLHAEEAEEDAADEEEEHQDQEDDDDDDTDDSTEDNEEDDYEDGASTWRAWNWVRTMCEQHPALGVALEITPDLPDATERRKWKGEPVVALIFPTSVFLTNNKGFPCLSKAHQRFVLDLLELQPQLMVTGMVRHHVGGNTTHSLYLQYLAHLSGRLPTLSEDDRFSAQFRDFLQAPLQPLMDNLEAQTYETFERDPVKYKQYQEAVRRALLDRASLLAQEGDGEEEEEDTTEATGAEKERRREQPRSSRRSRRSLVLMVVGAGRGPLVEASICAAREAGMLDRVRVYAVEKNPNAVVTLRNRQHDSSHWANVTIVHQDMRRYEAVEPADILVSELLGSFGDNELSPECLDGAQRFLRPGGISIPCSYTSFAAPLMSSKLWNEVKRSSFGTEKLLKAMETPYVVNVFNAVQLSPEQEVFTFTHPTEHQLTPLDSGEPVPHEGRNRRQASLTFHVPGDHTVHGIAGYFEAVLYKGEEGDVKISIAPHSFSTGMFSWFPLFFPLRTPVQLRGGEDITVQFWRCCTESKVWYEWGVSDPGPSPIHNPNGRSYWIGL